VLGFSAKEVAEALDTTVASVNSALQRARETVDGKLPEQSQQETLRSLGDAELTELVESFMDAMVRHDVAAVVDLLAEDAAWSMPPMATWFHGREAITAFLSEWPLSGEWRWHHLRTHANGQPAIGAYTWDEESQAYKAFALNVLTYRGDKIVDITSFITREQPAPEILHEARWPDEPVAPLRDIFGRFGLPDEVRL
jgi:RNA polymerase sigma-70 factor, ECF subfamily